MNFKSWLIGAAALALGCQQAPITRPRILSVQTPAGMPSPPSLSTTRNNPLSVPTAPVRTGATQVVPAPATVVQPPAGAVAPTQVIPVPAAPPVQGLSRPNTIQQYPPAAIATPQPVLVPAPNPEAEAR
jgi:hypothetical protein